jgi:hypothetical protein
MAAHPAELLKVVLIVLWSTDGSSTSMTAHHSEMGNLLSLDVSIHQRRADAKRSRGDPNVNGHFEALNLRLMSWSFDGCLDAVQDDDSREVEKPMQCFGGTVVE